MRVKIKQGHHLSSQITRPRFNIFGTGSVVCKVKFTKKSLYDILGEDALDWNKLSCGCSWGFSPLMNQYMMHFNSSRWDWRRKVGTDKIELSPYYYDEGKRYYAEKLGIKPVVIDLDVEYNLIINPVYSDTVLYEIDKEGINLFTHMAHQHVPTLKGFLAPAYFGGTKPAPSDIEYEIKYL